MILPIPAIDLIDGKCVRLTQGDFNQKTEYGADPLAMAQRFEDAGLTHLHLVDLDGARQKKVVNYKVLERLATRTGLHIDFGGGIQSNEDIAIAFNSGAQQITAGSVAVKEPELVAGWLLAYGPEKIILGADARQEKIAVSGWQESTDVWVYDFIEKYVEQGVRTVISTDVAKDGLLQGPSFELYQKISERTPAVRVIASGGVSGLADVEKLDEMGLHGVIVGKALYEGRITLAELSRFIAP